MARQRRNWGGKPMRLIEPTDAFVGGEAVGSLHHRLDLALETLGQIAHDILDLVIAAALHGIVGAKHGVDRGAQSSEPSNHEQASSAGRHPAGDEIFKQVLDHHGILGGPLP